MMGHKICFYEEIWKIIPKISRHSLSGALGYKTVWVFFFYLQHDSIHVYLNQSYKTLL